MSQPAILPSLRIPLVLGLCVGILTAGISLFIPNQYKSEARILPADSRGASGLAGVAAAAAAVGVTIPGQDSADAAYVDILNSRWLREKVLHTRFHFRVQSWRFGAEELRDQTLFEYLKKKNMDRAIKALKEDITISRDLKTKLLTISVETPSPELSQQVARRIVGLLDEFVVGKSQTRGGAKASFAEKRLLEARGEMAEAEEQFRRFLDGNRNYLQSAEPAVRLKGIRLENELKLRTQLVTTLAVGREQALLEEKNDMPILNVLDSGNLPIEKSAPSRASLVLAAMAVAIFGSIGWQHREGLRAFLAAEQD